MLQCLRPLTLVSQLRPRSLLSKILMGFCSDGPGPSEFTAKFEVHSFTHAWDNSGYFKNLGSSWIRLRSLFSKSFNCLLFGWTLWMYRPNLKSVALPVPEVVSEILQVFCPPEWPHPYFTLILGVFPLHQMAHVGVSQSRGLFSASYAVNPHENSYKSLLLGNCRSLATFCHTFKQWWGVF